jgi:hypothetical protein
VAFGSKPATHHRRYKCDACRVKRHADAPLDTFTDVARRQQIALRRSNMAAESADCSLADQSITAITKLDATRTMQVAARKSAAVATTTLLSRLRPW